MKKKEKKDTRAKPNSPGHEASKVSAKLPRNLKAHFDFVVFLFVMLALLAVLAGYDGYMATMGLTLWIALAAFTRERSRDRDRHFARYVNSVVGAIGFMSKTAAENLPQAILIINEDFRLEWLNGRVAEITGKEPPENADVKEIWENILTDASEDARQIDLFSDDEPEGEYVFATDGETIGEKKYFKVHYVSFTPPSTLHSGKLAILYIMDLSELYNLRDEFRLSRASLLLMQIDNYDEITASMSETERTTLLLEVGKRLDAWATSLTGLMRRVKSDTYVVIVTRSALDKALREKFDILDKVRELKNSKNMPVTLSVGAAVCEGRTMSELNAEAQRNLDLALGRGGDQAAVTLPGNDKPLFFGGRTQAVEKHTRVKSRVVAHAIRELMESADAVYIMGHANEDFDAIGAAIGMARLSVSLNLPTQIILSDMNDGIEKLLNLLLNDADTPEGEKFGTAPGKNEEYRKIIRHIDDAAFGTAINPLLIVVDTHIPHLTAAPKLLERIKKVIVIDHHRRAEISIANPQLVYIEPSASSTSELITEIVTYFGEDANLTGLDATALYAGIVVDTKNFAVSTGVRTFDAAAFLRRSGADPVIVRHLFRSDYETTMALAKIQVNSEYYKGGLIVGSFDEVIPNIQAIAAQAADSFLRIENTRMSIVCFNLPNNTVGISARSTGELNVQVIMEKFGGGGHANVAGAQIKSAALSEIKEKVVIAAKEYIAESEEK